MCEVGFRNPDAQSEGIRESHVQDHTFKTKMIYFILQNFTRFFRAILQLQRELHQRGKRRIGRSIIEVH